MKIGILRESKVPPDTRVPLTPGQCRMLEEKLPGLKVLVQPSPFRCFSDSSYAKEGISVTEDLSDCDVLFGVKEVKPGLLIPGKTYFFFSHTIKKQNHNRQLLRSLIEKKIRLVDYEVLTDKNGNRIIGFGRWAGLTGSYLGIRAYGLKYGVTELPHITGLSGYDEMINIARHCKLPPLKIAITGDGRVGNGVCEMLSAFRVQRVSADDFPGQSFKRPVYTQLGPGRYNQRNDGAPFDLRHFFSEPGQYHSTFPDYYRSADLLIAAAYWDPHAPVLFTKQQMTVQDFRIRVIADISCDLNGSIPSTIRTTTFSDPYYDYNPFTEEAVPAFSDASNITVMSIDNLPCGLPAEASADFGRSLSTNILPLLVSGDPEGIIQKATITSGGSLTKPYEYLGDWVALPEEQTDVT